MIKKRKTYYLDLCQFGTSSVTVVRLPSGFWVDLRQMFGHNVCKFGSNFVAEFARIEKGAKGGSCMSQWFDDCIWLYMAGWSCIYVRIGWYWFSFLNELNPIDRIKKHISSFRSKQEQRLTQFCCSGAEDSIPRAPPLRNLQSFVGLAKGGTFGQVLGWGFLFVRMYIIVWEWKACWCISSIKRERLGTWTRAKSTSGMSTVVLGLLPSGTLLRGANVRGTCWRWQVLG